MKKGSLFILPATVCLAFSACGQSVSNEVSLDSAKLSETILAIRMSPQLHDINRGANKGQVILVDEKGELKTLEVGPMDVGKILWSDNTVYFSGPKDEFALTKEKLTSLKRGTEEVYQTDMFQTPDKKGFISIYNVGFTKHGYQNLVTTGDASAIESWNVQGLFEAIHQCGNKLVGITHIEDTGPPNTPPNTTATTMHSKSTTEVLLQIYPKPAPNQAPLGTFTHNEELSQSLDGSPCVDGVTYTLSTLKESGDNGKGTQSKIPILRSWDTQTGKHQMRKLHDPDGKTFSLPSKDNVSAYAGSVINGKYVWCNHTGAVYRTDLSNGETIKLFAASRTPEGSGNADFLFYKNQLLVLDLPDNNQKKAVTLTSYNIDTGAPTLLISIPHSPHSAFNKPDPFWGFENNSIVRDMAVDPNWLDRKTSQK